MLASSAGAAVFSVDTESVLGNQTGAPISISVTGGEAVSAFTLFAEILDDGIPDGTTVLPTFRVIDGADLITGTIFESKAPTQSAPFNTGTAYNRSVDAATVNPALANGSLGRLFLDTTGLMVGDSFRIRFVEVLGSFNSTLTSPTGTTITLTGETITTITVIPEPASFAVIAGAGLVLLRRRRA
ncbi:MAG TPA: hypothetical protein VGB55_05400 [Tepidisphaeraceae bacterium]